MSYGDTKRQQRLEAATACMFGLLAGNSLLSVPTDGMCYSYARDAVRLADALLHTLEVDATPDMQEPQEIEDAIYPDDYRRLQALAEFNEQEAKARGETPIGVPMNPPSFYDDPSRVDVGPVSAPVPDRDPRG